MFQNPEYEERRARGDPCMYMNWSVAVGKLADAKKLLGKEAGAGHLTTRLIRGLCYQLGENSATHYLSSVSVKLVRPSEPGSDPVYSNSFSVYTVSKRAALAVAMFATPPGKRRSLLEEVGVTFDRKKEATAKAIEQLGIVGSGFGQIRFATSYANTRNPHSLCVHDDGRVMFVIVGESGSLDPEYIKEGFALVTDEDSMILTHPIAPHDAAEAPLQCEHRNYTSIILSYCSDAVPDTENVNKAVSQDTASGTGCIGQKIHMRDDNAPAPYTAQQQWISVPLGCSSDELPTAPVAISNAQQMLVFQDQGVIE